MKAFESTMSNIEKYLEEKNEAYKKINTKMAQGFIYKVVNGDVSYTVNVKVDEKLGFVILEAYPGVACKHPAFAPMLVKYCQSAHLEVGSLRVSQLYKDVYFRTEAYFADGEVSEKTLKFFENCASKVFEEHLPKLLSIANGRLLCDIEPVKCAEYHNISDNTENFSKSVEAICEYLLFSGNFNTAAENMHFGFDSLFVAETSDDNGRIKIEYSVNKSRTVIRVKASPGLENEIVSKGNAYMTSRFCNDSSDEKKLGSFFLDTDSGVCSFVDLMIIDTPISIDTLSRASTITVGMLEEYLNDFRLVSMGILPDAVRHPSIFHPGLRNIGGMPMKNMIENIDKKLNDIDFRIANVIDNDVFDESDIENAACDEDFSDFDELSEQDDTDTDE